VGVTAGGDRTLGSELLLLTEFLHLASYSYKAVYTRVVNS